MIEMVVVVSLLGIVATVLAASIIVVIRTSPAMKSASMTLEQ